MSRPPHYLRHTCSRSKLFWSLSWPLSPLSNQLAILSSHFQKSLAYNSSFSLLKTSIACHWWFSPLAERYIGSFFTLYWSLEPNPERSIHLFLGQNLDICVFVKLLRVQPGLRVTCLPWSYLTLYISFYQSLIPYYFPLTPISLLYLNILLAFFNQETLLL